MKKPILETDHITTLNVDAIVNAANAGLQAGGGVCGAIFHAAGAAKLQAACDRIGHCDTGSAVITDGFDLEARYIIHAVGPVYDRQHPEESRALLEKCYRSILDLAMEQELHSVAIPCISTGIFGYPLEEASETASATVCAWIREHAQYDLAVHFVCYTIRETHIYQELEADWEELG
jgi:O-acetyl-ADP-ribose deacetylase (regulator of RNase III)